MSPFRMHWSAKCLNACSVRFCICACVSPSTRSITLYTMEKLCRILHCTANDIVCFINEE